MKIKIGNRVMKIQTDFLAMGPTIFESWVMETELWVMETQNPNTPLEIKFSEWNFTHIYTYIMLE